MMDILKLEQAIGLIFEVMEEEEEEEEEEETIIPISMCLFCAKDLLLHI
jgi:hypothetical protein